MEEHSKIYNTLVPKILGLFRWLTQSITLMFIPDSRRRSVHLSFRPIVPILLLIAVLMVLIFGVRVSAKLRTSGIRIDAAVKEVQSKKQELSTIKEQVDSMVSLMDEFQATLGLIPTENKKGSIFSSDISSGDIVSLTPVNDINSDKNIADVEKLKVLNTSIEESIIPLQRAINQLSKESKVLSELPTGWPVANHTGYISFLFGPNFDPLNEIGWYLHRGVDIAGMPGTPVVAAADGTVAEVKSMRTGYGNYVRIQHKYGFYTLYAHMQRILISLGDTVKQGDVIGLLGSTGRVTGPHLHFEVRIGSQLADPLVYLRMSSVNDASISSMLSRYRFNANSHDHE